MENEFVISNGTKKIVIKDESGEIRGVISFNPTDTVFVERFYQLIKEFQNKSTELEEKTKALDEDTQVDDNGIFLNMGERLAFIREICEYLRTRIDQLFGPETSQIAFGDTLSLELFPQFFTGISPFIQEVRKKKMDEYTKNDSPNIMK